MIPPAKRTLDLIIAVCVSVASAPVVGLAALAIFLGDGRSPFYLASRIGAKGRVFRMYKLRSMVPNADRTGVDSTAADDPRLTRVGSLVRRLKLDEFPQFWNVLRGDMSVVGPRPNVERETTLYTTEELELLSVAPGVTDLSSIVFADYSQILAGQADPDIAYNQLIRPWKSRLGLLYARAPWSLAVDLRVIFLTAVALTSRRTALRGARQLAKDLGADARLVEIAGRDVMLVAAPPPGASEIVTSRRQHLSSAPSGGIGNR